MREQCGWGLSLTPRWSSLVDHLPRVIYHRDNSSKNGVKKPLQSPSFLNLSFLKLSGPPGPPYSLHLLTLKASQVEDNRALYVQRMSEGKESIKTPSDRSSMDISKAYLTKPASLSDGEKAEASQPADEAFLVEWDGDDDPLNPRSFSSVRKWLIIFIVSMGTLNV